MEKILISKIKLGSRVRKDIGNISELARSLEVLGLLHPVVLLSDMSLVAGARRLAAAKSLGWEKVPAHIVSGLNEAALLLQAERDENTCRLDFAPSEAVAMGRKLEEIERPVAEERRRQTQGRPKKGSNKTGGKLPPDKTRDVVGRSVGMSGKNYQKAKAVIEAAEADPELVGVVEEMDRTGNVNKAAHSVRRNKQKKAIEAARQSPKKTIKGALPDLIVADPPWQYAMCETESRAIENQYPTSTVAEICKHCPTTKTNAVLFLWSTAPLLVEALQVMDAWGFTYKSNAVWDKQKLGMGYWFRGQHEILLVGTKGKVSAPPDFLRVSSVFSEKRGKHSKKPECVMAWIEKAFPGTEKLEMYFRTPREGWQTWGNEI